IRCRSRNADTVDVGDDGERECEPEEGETRSDRLRTHNDSSALQLSLRVAIVGRGLWDQSVKLTAFVGILQLLFENLSGAPCSVLIIARDAHCQDLQSVRREIVALQVLVHDG